MTLSALRRSLLAELAISTIALAPASASAQLPRQSPIDIRTRDLVPALDAPSVDFRYSSDVDVTLDYVERDDPREETVEVAVPDGAATLLFGGTSYELDAFHWHTPSEHELNGRSFPLEQHLVHRTADGRVLVVGVLIEQGLRNAQLGAVFGDLPEEGEAPRTIRDFDLNRLLPRSRASFRYPGSLTTSPFTEGVQWVVLAGRVRLGQAQIGAFQDLFPRDNSREVQPLNGRVVQVVPR